MPYSYTQYTGTGAVDTYTIPFNYLLKDHVKVRIDAVLKTVVTDYTFLSATQIKLNSNLANGAILEIRRETPVTEQFVNFADASTLQETDLDNNALQGLYVVQEADDDVQDALRKTSTNVYDALNRRIVNVADPTGAQDAVTRAFLDAAVTALGNLPSVAGHDNKFLRVVTGIPTWVTLVASMISDATAYGISLLQAANAAAARTLLVVADAVHTHAGADIASGTVAAARLGSGTPDATNFLRGDSSWQVVTVPVAASQAEMETATDTTKFVTPGRTKNHPGVAKAALGINFSSGTPTAFSPLNIASLTDNGVGDATINFTTAFSAADYVMVATGTRFTADNNRANLYYDNGTARTTSAIRVNFRNENSNTNVDLDSAFAAFFGDQ